MMLAHSSNSSSRLSRPYAYGDVDDSLEVHDEIREVGDKLRKKIQSDYTSAQGSEGVLKGLRDFGAAPGAQKLMNSEMAAALWSIQTGLYVSFRSSDAQDCCRVGPETLCFCNHPLKDHSLGGGNGKAPCSCCQCPLFNYIPLRPEEIGYGHLCRRKEFNITKWSPKCRCTHGAAEHQGTSKKCKKCSCFHYESDWACVVCDKKWGDHTTEIETAATRQALGLPVGEAYKPLSSLDPEFSGLVFGRKNSEGVHELAPRTAYQQGLVFPRAAKKRTSGGPGAGPGQLTGPARRGSPAATSSQQPRRLTNSGIGGGGGGGDRGDRGSGGDSPGSGSLSGRRAGSAEHPGMGHTASIAPEKATPACVCGASYATATAKFCGMCGTPRTRKDTFGRMF